MTEQENVHIANRDHLVNFLKADIAGPSTISSFIEFEELDYYEYDESFELDDYDEREIFQQFVWYMISKNTVIEDEKTNIMFQNYKKNGGI